MGMMTAHAHEFSACLCMFCTCAHIIGALVCVLSSVLSVNDAFS